MVLKDAYIFFNCAYIAHTFPLSTASLVATVCGEKRKGEFPQKQTSLPFTNKIPGHPRSTVPCSFFTFFFSVNQNCIYFLL